MLVPSAMTSVSFASEFVVTSRLAREEAGAYDISIAGDGNKKLSMRANPIQYSTDRLRGV